DWFPFNSCISFELTDFVFTEAELSKKKVNCLLELWAAMLIPHGVPPPTHNHTDLLQQVDSIPLGNVPWECFCLSYNRPPPKTNCPPKWKFTKYEVWFCNPCEVIKDILSNTEFNGSQCWYCNMMSGDWAWQQSDMISSDPSTYGSMLVPIILGSDKTMVSVVTGQNEYYPLYLSVGNVQNHMRRAHKNALVVISFLPILKGARKDTDTEEFHQFKQTLTHKAIANILLPIKPFMKTLDIVQCPDQYFCHVLYGLGLHISDYPEQAMIAWILMNWCLLGHSSPNTHHSKEGWLSPSCDC
ncbi:hypothetical protein BDM02DRAFT_3235661, partial [Thelephora ganbajun]